MFSFRSFFAALVAALALSAPAAHAFRVQLLCTAEDGSVQLACVDLGAHHVVCATCVYGTLIPINPGPTSRERPSLSQCELQHQAQASVWTDAAMAQSI